MGANPSKISASFWVYNRSQPRPFMSFQRPHRCAEVVLAKDRVKARATLKTMAKSEIRTPRSGLSLPFLFGQPFKDLSSARQGGMRATIPGPPYSLADDEPSRNEKRHTY